MSDGEYPYLDNLADEEWTNKIRFDQNIDSVFQKAFTALDLLAHLLFECFGLKTERKKERKLIRINKSFHNAMSQIKFLDRELYSKLEEIRGAREFQEASKVRNDIIHNQPPYEKWNQKVKNSDGTETMVAKYTPSKRLLEIAQGLLECIKRIFVIIMNHLNKKIACS
ncbi:Cthe_2314 family HEPN domain-containing protein [Bacillus cereus]|uniref:Cthe_2314 family HEPN domain-containing protein n=1 Tax=Bacillus cereus TaxID=1396 RepID=UPI0020D21292|nr:Cthe_2314 family HEPN domain-containing protein [Bacillus cereus]